MQQQRQQPPQLSNMVEAGGSAAGDCGTQCRLSRQAAPRCDPSAALDVWMRSASSYAGTLETLALWNLAGLEKLPDTICSLTALKSMTIDNCGKITELPADIGNLRALRTLKLVHSSVKELPASIGSLGLQTLDLYDLNHLKKLPDTVGSL